MNQVQAYLDLQKKQKEELAAFPIAYAFNNKQLEEALTKLGATKAECVTYMGHGDILKREDVPAFEAMLMHHAREMQEALKDEEFAVAAFLHEMYNHEYAINYDGDAEVLAAFAMDEDDLDKLGLKNAYRRARKQYFKESQEWELN